MGVAQIKNSDKNIWEKIADTYMGVSSPKRAQIFEQKRNNEIIRKILKIREFFQKTRILTSSDEIRAQNFEVYMGVVSVLRKMCFNKLC